MHNKWQAYCSFCQKFSIYQTWALPVWPGMRQGKKHSEIQISESLKIGAAFFGKSNTGKGQTNDKDPASKESQTSLRTVESISVPVNTLPADVLCT